MSTALLSLEAIDVVAAGAWLLEGVSLEVVEGSTVALVGGPGAGKSLVIDLVLGLVAPRAGAVRLDGRNITALAPLARQRSGIRAAFADPPVFPGLTVGEHLALAVAGGRLRSRARNRLAEYLPELDGRLDQPVEAQGAALIRLIDLARAMLGMPRILLIDDLFPALGTERAGELVRSLARDGYTLLLADRYGEAVLDHADHGYVLAQGTIVAEGAPAKLRADPRLLATCAGDSSAWAEPPD
ncbi:MAG: ATP-binding cassette domain-containing protein [Geminicoccaceae bacterium]